MGQSDLQFKAYLRLLLDDIQDLRKIVTEPSAQEKLDKMAEQIQKSLEE